MEAVLIEAFAHRSQTWDDWASNEAPESKHSQMEQYRLRINPQKSNWPIYGVRNIWSCDWSSAQNRCSGLILLSVSHMCLCLSASRRTWQQVAQALIPDVIRASLPLLLSVVNDIKSNDVSLINFKGV